MAPRFIATNDRADGQNEMLFEHRTNAGGTLPYAGAASGQFGRCRSAIAVDGSGLIQPPAASPAPRRPAVRGV